MIVFNKPCVIGDEYQAVVKAIQQGSMAGNGPFSKKVSSWLEENLGTKRALLTPSCTAALEMAAILTDVGPGDEVIMPSYTFVSTANAFALRGAAIRFVDVEQATMNIDPAQIQAAITEKTKVIVVVHYAGVSCDMEAIMALAKNHHLWVVEDAAQGLMSTYHGQSLGTIGHFGTISFHETKNYQCGEGGALLINDADAIERAEIIQEKGTNRSQFKRGHVDKYSWCDIGSSYLLSELNAAFLYAQLAHAEAITRDRLRTWQDYDAQLRNLPEIETPFIPPNRTHNAHMYYIKTANEQTADDLMAFLKARHIMAVTHYVPLHASLAGKKFGEFIGKDRVTTADSARLIRLPLYYGMEEKDVAYVCEAIMAFYQTA
ncbi:dTDP-4-amino-4,6-dideoxygalactose transaminase [Virgibacillus sp. 179-BFC.A HS]|uniref:dTDP-4-amino-4,6-dideoxygalactose transaminase n=1 Tax=Tigheibacillus jepli TaxID=3035914 RepID=A0ABU5CER7_9BACI|nr:dTDP-4-amino-4,6-dideoxygalactose transaminase [Virgibacillus sp. 179-BFC.A HS]MDY0404352.1 dTDP-4-amino-4,6-dideoxygalactose transaminase [Virgibacillus sp. 179-BFC.A HS]